MISQETQGTNILLVTNHEIFAYSIKHLLQDISDNTIINYSSTGNDAIAKAKNQKYDILIIDLDILDFPGFELVKRLHKLQQKALSCLFTRQEKFWFITQLRKSNADIIVLRNDDVVEIKRAIEHALCKEKYYSTKYIQLCQIYQDQEELTTREIEVLKGIADGKTSSDIAEGLFVSSNTIEFHRKKLLRKLNACNVAELIKKAYDFGYL